MFSIHKKKKTKKKCQPCIAWPASYGNRCRWAEKEGGGMAGLASKSNKKTYSVGSSSNGGVVVMWQLKQLEHDHVITMHV